MNKPKHKKTIKNTVLAQIKSGQAIMKPKWHFVLKTILVAVGVVIVAFALIYLVSFIFFILRQTGVFFVPSFGFRGVGIFLVSLPWFMILTGLVFFVTLEILVKRYSFTYRKPLLYSLIGIIIFVLIGSFIVSRTGLHQGLFRYAEDRRLPVVGRLYRGYGLERMEKVNPGIVDELTDEGFRMTNRQGETLNVLISSDTRFPLGADFEIGDRVVVLGERENGTIEAYGVRRIDDEMRRFPRRGGLEYPLLPSSE